MNQTITPTSVLAPLLPSLDAIAVARGRPTGERYELEDTVLRGIGWAEDIGPEAAQLHAHIAQSIADKAAADEAARIQAEADAAAAALLYVPRAITNADLRRALIAIGINPQLITDYLSSLPEGAAKWTALADWEYSNYVERAHPMLDQLAPSFGLTGADIDALFKSKPEYPLIGP
jgi:crotonobetainyl-CoA:carnitine CoA-transferase CaiB-like acyl-CoA transferase